EDAADVRWVLLRHHQMPVVPGIRLVDRGRRDARAAVALEALLHLLRRRAVGRERDEEVSVQRVLERGWPVVRRDRGDRALERRRRLDRALLSGRERDETGVLQEGAGPLGPLLVLLAHALGW